MKLNKTILFYVIILFINTNVFANETPTPLTEKSLEYKINKNFLQKGHFQYFFGLFKQDFSDGDPQVKYFKNLMESECKTKTQDILTTFLPLDIKNLWADEDENYLAVAKMSYILPIRIDKVDEKKINTERYLQQTMPNYKVQKHKNLYHVNGSLLTPEFNLSLKFLSYNHPHLKLLKDVDPEKIKEGKMKVSIQFQDQFGKVMMVDTAKMASAVTIYQEFEKGETLVT